MRSGWADAAMWAAPLAAVLAFDALLIRTGRDSLSTRAGRHPRCAHAALCYLAAHFAGRPQLLSRVDPLRIAASRLRKD